MIYVLQDHNQSLQVLHLEMLQNRTILQNLCTNNVVCNKPGYEDLWWCNTSHNMFLETYDISFQTWELGVAPHLYCCPENCVQCSKQICSTSRLFFPFPAQNL